MALGAVQARAEANLTELVRKTKPAVVQISSYDATGKLLKNGSGFFLSPGGELLTHRSLLLGAVQVKVRTLDGQELPVTAVVAEDPTMELVKLQVTRSEVPGPCLSVNATQPEAGERLLVMGATKKGEFLVDEALVSGIREFLAMGKVMHLSTKFNPTLHGGPVLNLKGEVVGVAGMGKSQGREFSYGIPGAAIVSLKPATAMNFPEWAAAHAQETVDSYLKKADAALKAKRGAEALAYYRAALKVSPHDPELHVQLGLAFLLIEQPQEAVTAFRQAAALKEDHAMAHYYAGLAFLKLNDQAEVRKEVAVLHRLDRETAERLQALLQVESKAAVAAADLPELVKKIKPAVVRVFTFNRENRPKGSGSGFFINSQGHFITNYHVLMGATRAQVKTQDGKTYPVTRLLAEDYPTDLILAAIATDRETPFLPVSKTLPQVGERVVVIGNPKSLEWTVADGVVSAIRNLKQGRWRGVFIQTSAPISPGSSGGPAINMKGEVIGVNTWHKSSGQLLDFSSSARNILALKPGPGVTLEKRAEGWRQEAGDLLNAARGPMKEKKYKDAIEILEKAAKLVPDLPQARYELGRAYALAGNSKGAGKELKALRKMDSPMAKELEKQLKTKSK